MEQKFYRCSHCGNIISYVENKGVPVMCCGEKMQLLVAGEKDASLEKHVPVYSVEGNVVKVAIGSAEHPMIPEHFIQWVCLVTEQGSQLKYLQPGQKPEVSFAMCEGDKVVAVYEYCNLHGLWKA